MRTQTNFDTRILRNLEHKRSTYRYELIMRNMFGIDVNGGALAESKTTSRFQTITVRESVVVRNDAGTSSFPGPAFKPVNIEENPILILVSGLLPRDYSNLPLSRLIGDLESCAKRVPECCDALWKIMHDMEKPSHIRSAEGFGDPALEGKMYALTGMLKNARPSWRDMERT